MGLRGIVVTLYVCLCVCRSVCLSVYPVNILSFYSSAISRDIDLKFIQDTYRVVLNSLEQIYLHRSRVKVTGTVYFLRHLLGYYIRWNNKNLRSREITSQKIRHCAISVPNLVTIGRHLTSFLTCATFNMLKAYTHISIFLASKVCPMLNHSDIYDIWEPIITIVIFN